MKSKQIHYKVRGRDEETYIFLDKHDDGTYSVRIGHSVPVSYFEWKEESTTQSVEEFLSTEPSYKEKVEQLIAEFEGEDR